MSFRNRHFLKLLDFGPTELDHLVQATLTLKRLQKCGQERPVLKGKSIALLCEKTCQEIRWAFQVAVSHHGATCHYFGPGETGLSSQDHLSCSARQLGRLFDALAVMGIDQERAEELARLSGVPVFNLGSPEFNPMAILADLSTMVEHSARPLSELSLVFLGDGTGSLAHSALVGASKLGLDLRFCGPEELQPDETLVETCLALAAETGAQVRIFSEPEQAVKGADFVYSHCWIESDQSDWESRVEKLLPYRATSELLSQSGQGLCKLLHRLPVHASEETPRGIEISERFGTDGLEVSRELFDSTSNLSFEQAENHLHACKAVLVSLLT